MTIHELLSEFSIKIYEPPLSEMRDDNRIRDLTNPISVVMLIVDFETEVMMSGIINFIGNSTGAFANETVLALKAIGCDVQASLLQKILDIAAAAGMTHEAIQKERSGVVGYAVTSFTQTHGDKWNDATSLIFDLYSEVDYSDMLDQAMKFMEKRFDIFRIAVQTV